MPPLSKKHWLSSFDLSFCVVLLSPSLQDVQIVSTDENQVFLAIQEWYQSDTYNLYQSDPPGVYYSIVLENVRSTKQPEENVLIDILEVRQSGWVGTWGMDPGAIEQEVLVYLFGTNFRCWLVDNLMKI